VPHCLLVPSHGLGLADARRPTPQVPGATCTLMLAASPARP